MQDLDFRRKKKRRGGSGKTGRRRAKSRTRRELHLKDVKAPLSSAREKIHRNRSGLAGWFRELAVWGAELLIVCMLAVFLVAAFGQRVSMAGDSMSPALENGDVVMINRLIYQFKGPGRGDVVAFRKEDKGHYSLKRVVGLPGESVRIEDGNLLINGEELTEDIYVSDLSYAGIAEETVTLGEDEYFVIGDNASASDDSRLSNIGAVGRDEIYGQAWFIVSPKEDRGLVR